MLGGVGRNRRKRAQHHVFSPFFSLDIYENVSVGRESDIEFSFIPSCLSDDETDFFPVLNDEAKAGEGSKTWGLSRI